MNRASILKGLLSLLLFFSTSSFAASAISDLGLSVAGATMDSKNVANGLKNVAKDKTTQWMWDSVGGLEKMILQNNEAQMKEAANKLLEIVDIIQAIEKISISITEGKYDDAAIEAMDQVVGKVNHPLVSVTWSAVKLTYESHKAVVSTEEARQVEILYNMVTHDRMLLGASSPESKSPPTIPVNSQTADYFFNKYIMTNDNARRALRAYVVTVLNEDWPEQSWSDWLGGFRTIGMGVDTKKNAELEMLDKEWRNKGRTWVIAVIKEMNKQAKQSWAELKLRQELARFKRFASSAVLFKNNDLAQMMRDFKEIEKYKRELPQYKKALDEGKKLRAKMEIEVASLNTKSFSKTAGNRESFINNIAKTASDWQSLMMSYGSRASLIREEELVRKFSDETNQWRKLKNSVSAFILEKGDSASNEIVSETVDGRYHPSGIPELDAYWSVRFEKTLAYTKSYYNKYMDKIKPFSWDFKVTQVGSFYIPSTVKLPSKPEEFSTELLKILNKGDIGLASNVYDAWRSTARSRFDSYIYPLERASMGYFAYEAPKDLPEILKSRDDLEKNSGWQSARSALIGKLKILYLLEIEKYNATISPITTMMTSFKDLANERQKQYSIYANKINKIFQFGELNYDLQSYNEAYQKCSQNSYTKLPALDVDFGDTALLSIPSALDKIAYDVEHNMACSSDSGLIELEQKLLKEVKTQSELIAYFKELPALDNKDINQINILIKPQMDLSESLKRIKQIEKNIITTKNIISLISKMIPISTTDSINRQRDAFWLKEKAREVQSFIDYMLSSGKIKRGYNENYPGWGLEIVLPKSIQIKEKMLFSSEPQAHYLIQEEINTISTPLKALYGNSQAKSFLNSYFPKISKNLEDLLAMRFIQPVKGEHIIVRDKMIFLSDLQELENTLAKINIKEDSFDKKIEDIPVCFPSPQASRKFYFDDQYIDKDGLSQSKLGIMFLELRKRIKDLFLERRSFLITKEQNENKAKVDEEIQKANAEALQKAIEKTQKEEAQIQAEYEKIEEIKTLYSYFSQYYSSKDLSSLLSLISDDWESVSDSTTLMDLEDTLDNSFSIFDEVKCDISSLNINKIDENRYSVHYVISIVGFIYDSDIEHLEKSSVSEEVIINKDQVKILKTLNGNYWQKR